VGEGAIGELVDGEAGCFREALQNEQLGGAQIPALFRDAMRPMERADDTSQRIGHVSDLAAVKLTAPAGHHLPPRSGTS
jgi:hypothetical protein